MDFERNVCPWRDEKSTPHLGRIIRILWGAYEEGVMILLFGPSWAFYAI